MPEEKELHQIDLLQTFLANAINIVFMFFLLIVFAMFATVISSFDNDVNKLLGVVIELFAVVKLVTWCIHPQYVYKERKR